MNYRIISKLFLLPTMIIAISSCSLKSEETISLESFDNNKTSVIIDDSSRNSLEEISESNNKETNDGLLNGVYKITSYEIKYTLVTYNYCFLDFSLDQNVHVRWETETPSQGLKNGESVYSYSIEIDKNEDGVKKEYIDFTYLSGNEMTSIVFKKHNRGCYLMLSNDHNSIYYYEIIYGGSIVSPDGQIYHQNLNSTAEFTLLNE